MTQGSGPAGRPGVLGGGGQAYRVEYNDFNLKKEDRPVINQQNDFISEINFKTGFK